MSDEGYGVPRPTPKDYEAMRAGVLRFVRRATPLARVDHSPPAPASVEATGSTFRVYPLHAEESVLVTRALFELILARLDAAQPDAAANQELAHAVRQAAGY